MRSKLGLLQENSYSTKRASRQKSNGLATLQETPSSNGSMNLNSERIQSIHGNQQN